VKLTVVPIDLSSFVALSDAGVRLADAKG